MSENSESEERPPAQEVVLDSASEAHLISRIKEAIRGNGASSTSQTSTPSELSEEELTALTDVIDQHIEERVREKVGTAQGKTAEQAPAQMLQEERAKRIQETIAEASKHGRQGMSELLRVVFEAEREAKNKKAE